MSDWYTRALCADALCELNSVATPYIENALDEKTVVNCRGEKITLSERAVESLTAIIRRLKNRLNQEV